MPHSAVRDFAFSLPIEWEAVCVPFADSGACPDPEQVVAAAPVGILSEMDELAVAFAEEERLAGSTGHPPPLLGSGSVA